MASCGTRRQSRRWGRRHERNSARLFMTRAVFLLLVLVMAGTAMGCFPSTLRHGFPPQTDKLTTLTPGISTNADIILALGQPRGDGVARFTSEPIPRQIYFYEYVEAGTYSGKIGFAMLLVFLRDGRYDGHMWFASTSQLH